MKYFAENYKYISYPEVLAAANYYIKQSGPVKTLSIWGSA